MRSFLLALGPLLFWDILRRRPTFQLGAAGHQRHRSGTALGGPVRPPAWISVINTPADFTLAASALALLMLWKLPPWLVVTLSAWGGAAIAAI
jgi:chromate transporter